MLAIPDSNVLFGFHANSQLSSLMTKARSEAKSNDDKANTKKFITPKQSKFSALHFVIKRIGRRRKRVSMHKSIVSRVSSKASKQFATIDAVPAVQSVADSVDADTTFETQNTSIDARSDSPLLGDSPSAKDRKRFAGIWQDFDLALQIKAEQARAEKLARTRYFGQWMEFK